MISVDSGSCGSLLYSLYTSMLYEYRWSCYIYVISLVRFSTFKVLSRESILLEMIDCFFYWLTHDSVNLLSIWTKFLDLGNYSATLINLAAQFRNCINLAMQFEIGLQLRNFKFAQHNFEIT